MLSPQHWTRFDMGKRTLALCAFALFSIVLVLVFLTSSVLWAQEETPSIGSMRISVWPEYDDPRILVIYEGEFADASLFPQEAKFLAPRGAEINQVCALEKPGNKHLCQLYQTDEEDNSLAISYTLPIPAFYLEYYYDGLNGQTDRAFTYEFKSPYDIEKLEVDVQQPLRSSEFSISPAYVSVTSDGVGFKYYNFRFDNVAPGQVISIDASYTKADTRPSVSGSQGQGGLGGSSVPIVLGVTAAAAIGIVGWFVLFRRRGLSPKAAPAVGYIRKAKTIKPEAPATGARRKAGKSYFCSNCGLKLEDADNFCPSCGTKTKRHV